MKNRLITIFLVILLVVGVGILSYPMISNMLHDRKKDEILTEYNEEMEKLPDEKLEAAHEAAEGYNRSLMDTVIISDPFDPDTVRSLDEDYMQTLNLEKNGVMAYVEVPRLDIYEPVYHGTSDKVLAKGVGHLVGTSLPIGGGDGNPCSAVRTYRASGCGDFYKAGFDEGRGYLSDQGAERDTCLPDGSD